MAHQQAMLFEIITGMKRAIARDDEASESDEYITRPSNYGNKLKRKAKFVQEGQLSQADGPRSYKRRISYNGYTREIINKNPPRADPDGDVYDDEHESDPDLSPVEDNPYESVRLEEILMPLTSAAKLDQHTSLSVPYKSKILEEMVQNAQDLVHRELASLHRMKQVLVQFRGDNTWAACDNYESQNDAELLRTLRQNILTPNLRDRGVDRSPTPPADKGASDNEMSMAEAENSERRSGAGPVEPLSAENKHEGPMIAPDGPSHGAVMDDSQIATAKTAPDSAGKPDVLMKDMKPPTDSPKVRQSPTADTSQDSDRQGDYRQPTGQRVEAETTTERGNRQDYERSDAQTIATAATTDTHDHALNEDDEDDDDNASQLHHMTTRARAHAPTSTTISAPNSPNTVTADSDSMPSIHAFYIPPSTSLPSPSSSLPAHLADEIRRALSAYAQKQEEVVRQAESLLDGLRRAVKLKKRVWSWCRNEGHVGEMSDGEDWIDAEEWGLEEPLKKGEEVEDEEVGVSIGKKTRNRRAAA